MGGAQDRTRSLKLIRIKDTSIVLIRLGPEEYHNWVNLEIEILGKDKCKVSYLDLDNNEDVKGVKDKQAEKDLFPFFDDKGGSR